MLFLSKQNLTMISLGLLLGCTPSLATVFYVDQNVPNDSSSGESWENAFSSIQEAITATSKMNGGEIWVRAGMKTVKVVPLLWMLLISRNALCCLTIV